jgi:hypothetical protein
LIKEKKDTAKGDKSDKADRPSTPLFGSNNDDK